jgi:hypothetical protein
MNPDANWTGIALTGHLSTGVFLWGLGGLNRAAITSFNTSSISGYGSGTTGAADWILEGLNAGTYYVAIGGTQLGAFVVQAGDNSIEFSTTASGAFVLSQTAGSPIPTAMFGKIAAAGNFVIH